MFFHDLTATPSIRVNWIWWYIKLWPFSFLMTCGIRLWNLDNCYLFYIETFLDQLSHFEGCHISGRKNDYFIYTAQVVTLFYNLQEFSCIQLISLSSFTEHWTYIYWTPGSQLLSYQTGIPYIQDQISSSQQLSRKQRKQRALQCTMTHYILELSGADQHRSVK